MKNTKLKRKCKFERRRWPAHIKKLTKCGWSAKMENAQSTEGIFFLAIFGRFKYLRCITERQKTLDRVVCQIAFFCGLTRFYSANPKLQLLHRNSQSFEF